MPRNFVTIVPQGRARGRHTARSYFYTDATEQSRATSSRRSRPANTSCATPPPRNTSTLARAAIQITPAKNEPGKIAVTLAAGAKIQRRHRDHPRRLRQHAAEVRRRAAHRYRQRTLTKLTSSTIPAGTPFAFRVFGREVDSCQTDLDVPVGPLNPAAVAQRIAALVAKNGAKTPIGASLDKAADDLKSVTGEKLIVLVTDGEETCGGDPAASIERLRKAGIGTRVSIVGFALDDEKLATTFRRWSDAGGGAFFDAKDARRARQVADRSTASGFRSRERPGSGDRQRTRRRRRRAGSRRQSHVRIKGRANASKPVVVKPKETVERRVLSPAAICSSSDQPQHQHIVARQLRPTAPCRYCPRICPVPQVAHL